MDENKYIPIIIKELKEKDNDPKKKATIKHILSTKLLGKYTWREEHDFIETDDYRYILLTNYDQDLRHELINLFKDLEKTDQITFNYKETEIKIYTNDASDLFFGENLIYLTMNQTEDKEEIIEYLGIQKNQLIKK